MVGELDRFGLQEQGEGGAIRYCAWCGDRQQDAEDALVGGGVSHVICFQCLSDCLQALRPCSSAAA